MISKDPNVGILQKVEVNFLEKTIEGKVVTGKPVIVF